MIQITTYKGQYANFYIQSKGLHAGRPMRNPIPNCFAVETNIENSYEIIYSLWKGKSFKHFIGGSVIPFIKISDVKKIVGKAIDKADNYNKNNLKKIELIDKQIENTLRQLELLKQMQVSIAIQTNNAAQ